MGPCCHHIFDPWSDVPVFPMQTLSGYYACILLLFSPLKLFFEFLTNFVKINWVEILNFEFLVDHFYTFRCCYFWFWTSDDSRIDRSCLFIPTNILFFGKIQFFFWQTWSEFWKRIHVKLAILLKYHMVWFRLLTFWRFLVEFIIDNLDVENLYHELFPFRIAMLRGRPFTYRPPSWLTPPLLDVVL